MPEQEKTKMKIQCPACSSKLDVTDLKPFTVFSCPQCGSAVTVPMRFQAYVLEEYLESNGGIHRYRALDEKLDREVCVVICEASETHPWEQLERYLDLVRKVASVSEKSRPCPIRAWRLCIPADGTRLAFTSLPNCF